MTKKKDKQRLDSTAKSFKDLAVIMGKIYYRTRAVRSLGYGENWKKLKILRRSVTFYITKSYCIAKSLPFLRLIKRCMLRM